jgi:hypothetical protein
VPVRKPDAGSGARLKPSLPIVSRPTNRYFRLYRDTADVAPIRQLAPRGNALVARASRRAAQRHWSNEPKLTIHRSILSEHPRADCGRHATTLNPRIAEDRRLARSRPTIHFQCTDALQPDPLTRAAVDWPIDIMERDSEAQKRSKHALV